LDLQAIFLSVVTGILGKIEVYIPAIFLSVAGILGKIEVYIPKH